MAFQDDLTYGEAYEQKVMAVLPRIGFRDPRKIQGTFTHFDIATDGGTFEVKADRKVQKTGNIFFEFSYKGRASGVIGTAADFFVVVALGVAYIAPTECWHEFLRDCITYDVGRPVQGGDGNKSTGLLIPLTQISTHTIRRMHEEKL